MKRILFYITKNERENRHKNGTVKPSTDTPLLPSFIHLCLTRNASTFHNQIMPPSNTKKPSRITIACNSCRSRKQKVRFFPVAVLQVTRPITNSSTVQWRKVSDWPFSQPELLLMKTRPVCTQCLEHNRPCDWPEQLKRYGTCHMIGSNY